MAASRVQGAQGGDYGAVISTYLARMYVTRNGRGLDWIRSRSVDGGEG